jgi:enterochelin esterase-like enzyme
MSLSVGALLAAAVVAVGIAGSVRYVVTYWLYRGYPAPTSVVSVRLHEPDGGFHTVRVAPAKVLELTVRSPALGGWRDPVYVVLPPGYQRRLRHRYPVLYLLHGSPGEPLNFLDVGALVPAYEKELAEGQVRPMIIVMPSGARSPFGDYEWANCVPPGNDWETFIADDLVRTIDHRFRTIPTAEGRGIGGLSEGGYGALNIGFHHPGEFSLLESWSGYMQAWQSPALFRRDEATIWHDSPIEQVPFVAGSLRSHKVFVWMYVSGLDRMKTENVLFARMLDHYRVAHELSIASHGGHTWALWRAWLGPSLLVASDRLAHD